MKRSEMLSRMAFLIDSMVYLKKDCLEMAETILQMQEEIGMLPPFEDRNYNELGDNFVVLGLDQVRYTGACEWEPEDD